MCREVDFALAKVRLAPHNESAWDYLRGLAQLPGSPAHAAGADVRWRRACEQVLCTLPSCAPALALLADIYSEQAALLEEQAEEAAAAAEAGRGSGGGDGSLGAEQLGRAAAVARRLEGEVLGKLCVADPMRAPYYQYKMAIQPQGAQAQ